MATSPRRQKRAPSDFYYTLESYEPAIQVEFYLPQPAIREPGHINEILEPGFKHSFIEKYFLGEDGNVTSSDSLKVLNFINHDTSRDARESVKKIVERLKGMPWSYSMYTVEGAWSPGPSSDPVKEITDVIRAIFRFDSGKLIGKLGGVRNGQITAEDQEMIEMAVRSHPNLPVPEGSSKLRRVFKEVRQWQSDITFFAFGFIGYRVWEAIKKNRQSRPLKDPEQEIWTTFNPTVRVRRVVRQGYSGSSQQGNV